MYLYATWYTPHVLCLTVLVFIGAVVNPVAGNLSLVTEVCGKGDLYSYLHSSEKINWATRISLATDVAQGMHYLHGGAGIIQRDLKSTNLLLDDYYTVKIADFGLSRQLRPMGQMETYCGTPATMAPEIVRQEAYDEKADVFSFAIILWEILTREDPYPDKSGLGLAYAVANEGLRPPIPAYCPLEYAQLMSRSWRHDPRNRPSFSEVLNILQLMRQMIDNELRITRTKWSFNAAHAQQLQGIQEIERLTTSGDAKIQISADTDDKDAHDGNSDTSERNQDTANDSGMSIGLSAHQEAFSGKSPLPSTDTPSSETGTSEISDAKIAKVAKPNETKRSAGTDKVIREARMGMIQKSTSARRRYKGDSDSSKGNDRILRSTTLDRYSFKHQGKRSSLGHRRLRRAVGSADEADLEEEAGAELQQAHQSVEMAENAQKQYARKLEKTLLRQKKTEEYLQQYISGDSPTSTKPVSCGTNASKHQSGSFPAETREVSGPANTQRETMGLSNSVSTSDLFSSPLSPSWRLRSVHSSPRLDQLAHEADDKPVMTHRSMRSAGNIGFGTAGDSNRDNAPMISPELTLSHGTYGFSMQAAGQSSPLHTILSVDEEDTYVGSPRTPIRDTFVDQENTMTAPPPPSPPLRPCRSNNSSEL